MKCLSSCLWPVETSRVHKLGANFEGAVDHLTTVTKVDRMEIANRSCQERIMRRWVVFQPVFPVFPCDSSCFLYIVSSRTILHFGEEPWGEKRG